MAPVETYAKGPAGPFVRLATGEASAATQHFPDLVGKVSLVCTSPPYTNAISYDKHAATNRLGRTSENFRDRPPVQYNEYLDELDQIWAACARMLTPEGVLAINVGSVLHGGNHIPLPHDITARLLASDEGWHTVTMITWNKVTAGVKRAGVVIQNPFPGYWYPNIMTEKILIFSRVPGVAHPRKELRDYPAEWDEGIWDIAPVPPRRIPHPAPFPEELPHRLICMFSRPGELVLDPFNGSGTTTKAALDLARNSLGIERESAYTKFARQRLEQASLIRPKQLETRLASASDVAAMKTRNQQARQGSGKRRPH